MAVDRSPISRLLRGAAFATGRPPAGRPPRRRRPACVGAPTARGSAGVRLLPARDLVAARRRLAAGRQLVLPELNYPSEVRAKSRRSRSSRQTGPPSWAPARRALHRPPADRWLRKAASASSAASVRRRHRGRRPTSVAWPARIRRGPAPPDRPSATCSRSARAIRADFTGGWPRRTPECHARVLAIVPSGLNFAYPRTLHHARMPSTASAVPIF